MAGVSDEQTVTLGPWPQGVNNTAKEHALPAGALRAAVNMDLDDAGNPSRRGGFFNVVAAQRGHSLFGGASHLLAVVDGDLRAYDPNLSETTLRAGVGDRYATAAQVLDEIYWSNGVQIRRFDAELGDHPVWLDTPPAPGATPAAHGGLAAGDYEVALTWRDARGRESGASAAAVVTVPANGGITLTLPTVPAEGASVLRVYASAPDGTVLYHAIDVPAGQPMLLLGAHSPGKACETQWLHPLPPAAFLRFWNGRVLAGAGNLLCWSEALRFGLMHHSNTLRVGATLTLVEPLGEGTEFAGVFVADHARTYWLAGGDPKNWQRSIRYPHAAVPGVSAVLPGTAFGLESAAPVAVWLASNGVFCLGLPGGEVRPLREGELALPDGERGTAAFREVNGFRQMMTSYLAGGAQRMAATDSASATVRRNGVTVA